MRINRADVAAAEPVQTPTMDQKSPRVTLLRLVGPCHRQTRFVTANSGSGRCVANWLRIPDDPDPVSNAVAVPGAVTGARFEAMPAWDRGCGPLAPEPALDRRNRHTNGSAGERQAVPGSLTVWI